MNENLPDLIADLRSEAMRTALLVGLISIPVGFLWIALLGSRSMTPMLLAGAVVGLLYSNRPTPVFKAGAVVGVFAPVPELLVQLYPAMSELWMSSAGIAVKSGITAVVIPLCVIALAMIATVVVLASVATAALFEFFQPYLPDIARTEA